MGELQRDPIDMMLEQDMTKRHYNSGASGDKNGRWNGGLRHNEGYVYVLRPDHSRATKAGYVMRAILNWEEANGFSFPEDKMPHHKNLVRDDDRPENIEPKTHSEHTILHAKLRDISGASNA